MPIAVSKTVFQLVSWSVLVVGWSAVKWISPPVLKKYLVAFASAKVTSTSELILSAQAVLRVDVCSDAVVVCCAASTF